ncbi:AraC family transcriptional regulator [Variovorax sp. WS11]|uniref:AraC family transcriptional regulator n=1 Tax=Variovorax sp. WS11 TaxID=1105204 RepID=UPI000D0D71F4|nr:AraC family transcriptional regulator [Variovorax sp. WS11]NDZ17513.1 AraC family transcriptional regulator [Variovorax sp. WS11]PSL85957.1 AraC family transcriptional regulator [Variovorax sp. WS11]
MHDSQISDVFRWSTESLPRSQRLDAYAETLAKSLITVTTRSPDKNSFQCEMSSADLGTLKVTTITGSTKDSFRTRRDIAQSGGRVYHLAVGVGSWKFVHKAGVADLAPGDLVLIDTRFEYSSHLPEGFSTRTITLPVDWLHTWIPDPAALIGQCISGQSVWGSVLSSYIASLAPETAVNPPLPASLMIDQVGALLAMAASEIPACAPKAITGQAEMRRRIVDCIRQRSTDLPLTAADVAASLDLSARTLHRILALGGESFGAILLDARLEVAARMLRAMQFNHLTVAEIGRRAGFLDSSHFSRTCLARYGRTPGKLRQEQGLHQK